MTHPDLWHLAHRLPLRREVWRLRYRTVRGERATALVELRGLHLLAQVHGRRGIAELRSRDPNALADLLDAHPEDIARPFRRVR